MGKGRGGTGMNIKTLSDLQGLCDLISRNLPITNPQLNIKCRSQGEVSLYVVEVLESMKFNVQSQEIEIVLSD